MNGDIKDDILRVLIERAPNYVNTKVLRRRLPKHDRDEFTIAIEELRKREQISSILDERKAIKKPIYYYAIAQKENLPIQESIKVADLELPRILSCAKPSLLPGDFDEVVQQLAQYANNLETRFVELVKKERDAFWAKIISIFTIYVGLLAIVFMTMFKATPSAPIKILPMHWYQYIMWNLIELAPLTVIFLGVALLLRWIVKN